MWQLHFFVAVLFFVVVVVVSLLLVNTRLISNINMIIKMKLHANSAAISQCCMLEIYLGREQQAPERSAMRLLAHNITNANRRFIYLRHCVTLITFKLIQKPSD